MRILALIALMAAPAWAEVSDRLARIVPLPPGLPISVQVTIGTVVVSAWDRDEVSVEASRRAPDAPALARLPWGVERTADGLMIRAIQSDEGRDARLRTDFVLRVPAAAQLREVAVFEGSIELSNLRGISSARIERGNITAKDVSGTIRLETAIGNIRLERTRLAADGVVRLRTFNGDVTLALASRPEHARILALSMGGTVKSDIPLTVRDRSGPRFGEATLGNGQPLVSIDVVNGNVSITVPAEAR